MHTDLTDRWGEPHNHLPLTAEDHAAIARLLPLMWDELTFIGKRGDEYGVLVEGEYDDGYVPSAAEIAAWAAAAPAGAVFETFEGDAERPTFNDRWVAWAWFPESMAAAEAIEAAGRRWLGIGYDLDWEVIARREGWELVEGAPFPLLPGPIPESHLYHRNLDRVWPADDWEGAARDIGIGDDGTYADESAA